MENEKEKIHEKPQRMMDGLYFECNSVGKWEKPQ
jgi:hypothetical protein